MTDLLNIVWVLILLQFFIPVIQKRILEWKRINKLRDIETSRSSRVITIIHRQETMSLLGIPIARYIDIEDSERVLRAIRLTPPEMPIDLLLHTPGGLVLAAEQIAWAIRRHPAKVTVFIPHYAMSGGTLVALAADEIIMDPTAVLGPVDPQIGDPQHGQYPAASILAALQEPNPNRDDATLILGDVAAKAVRQVHGALFDLVKDKMPEEQARKFAERMSEGHWTHDYPISPQEAVAMGLPVKEEMPTVIYDLMDLYPQPGQRRPSVEYIPVPYRPSPPGPRRGRER